MLLKLLFASALACALASAQGRGGGAGMGEEGGMGGGSGRGGDMAPKVNFGPARVNRLDLMNNLLKLEKDQKKEVRAIMDEGSKEAAPLREQMAKARLRIAESVKSGGGQDEAVKNYAELESRMAAIELKAFARIYKLLDADQKQRTQRVYQMMNGVFKGKNWTEEQ
jgi:Spy/CpxP family protein refolding chaperone